jgi:2-methylcitrate dehydratase PrpD
MTDDRHRRAFLQQMAIGAASLAPSALGSAGSALVATEAQAEETGQTVRLAEYAAALRYEDIPPAVVQRAKDCIADAVATIAYGAVFPWSRMIIAYAKRNGAGGASRILGTGEAVHAPSAALANGALAHAFELDNLTKPSAGAHPGATLLSSTLAVAQERGIGGRDLVTAVVAGAEVMIRIGRATRHSNEERGFHAPGTTGPFGAAVAVGRLLGFDAARMTNAIGIAGSLGCGLLEFARSGTGAMVKRLHLGRAAESGVLAASLAEDGFTGPNTVLEGPFGFLHAYCKEWDLAELTRGLGERYVASIAIAGTPRMVRANNNPAPKDLMLAQYSIPFCVALALYRDPRDPRSFDEAAVHDPEIRALAAKTVVSVGDEPHDSIATTVAVTLRDGRVLTRRVGEFKGTPARPLDQAELREKFLTLTRAFGTDDMGRMFDRLQQIESDKTLDWLKI